MQVATVRNGSQSTLAVRSGETDQWRLIQAESDVPADMGQLIREWSKWNAEMEGICGPVLQDAKFCAPLSNPSKVICIGKNYADHAREMGGEPPEIPVVFSKFASVSYTHLTLPTKA